MEPTGELAADAPEAGVAPVLGRYSLGRRLGSGGFGTVFAGRDERLGKPVAVKVVPTSAPAPERGRREALAAARLDHPGIVAVFDAGEDEHARYLVSELVVGRTLDRLLAEGALSDRDVVRVGLVLAAALAHAHERGVVHRDVKPQNVIVPDDPRDARAAAKLADFGIAHLAGDEPLTHTGDVVGTLAYMAPEQAAGRRVDERADLYSLALVLYEALSGRNPVRAGTPAATARRVGTVLPSLRRARRDMPPELAAAIDRALRPAPEERGTIEDLTAALAAALPEVSDEGGTLVAHPLERPARGPLPPWSARAGAALAAGAMAALALAAVRGAVPAEVATGADPGADAAVPAGAAARVLSPAAAGVLAGIVVALVPRLGWLALAGTAVALLAGPLPAAAVIVAAAAAPVPALLRRDGTAWSLPAAAPALGLIGLAAAFPALAGRARRASARAALGALGAWALLLSESLLGRTLWTGAPEPAGSARAAWDALGAVVTSGALALAAVWALAALVLPWLVAGRRLSADVAAGTAWAAATAAAAAAVASELGAGEPRGLAAGAVAAAALAVAGSRVSGAPGRGIL
jgi:hypothetical protein